MQAYVRFGVFPVHSETSKQHYIHNVKGHCLPFQFLVVTLHAQMFELLRAEQLRSN